MAVRIRFRKYYECDTEAERSLDWGEDSLIFCIDSSIYYKIYAGDYVAVPADEVVFTSPIPITKIAISGVADGTRFLRDDGSWAEVTFPGAGHSIQSEGSPLTQRNNLNFTGALEAIDDLPGDASVVRIKNLGVTNAMINDVAWSKLTGTPTTLAGYGITGTKANFNSALSDGDFMFVGDAPTAHTHTTSDITNLSSYTGFDSRYYTETEVDTLLGGYQPLDGDLTSIAGLAGTSGLLRKTAANTWSLDTANYLTANQTITLSGDVTGSGTTAITTTVAATLISGKSVIGTVDSTNDYILIWDATDSTLKKVAPTNLGVGGGYTNLTQFVSQTAWRLFYSNTDGDVVELAFGANGTYLKSTGSTSAPIWDTPGGGGDVIGPASSTNNNVVFFDGLTGKLIKDSGLTLAGSNTGDVTLTGTPNYITISGQVITRALIDLASHVTGDLPFSNIAQVDTGTILYRKTAGTGDIETQTLATLKTDLGLTGTNSGDQTSIVGITGTKAQYNTSVTDGDFLFVGDITQYTDEMSQDAIGAMIDTSLVYTDGTPLLQRAALTGAITASAGSNTTALGSFTKAQLDAAVSDGNVMYVGDAPTAHTHTLANITDVTATAAEVNLLDLAGLTVGWVLRATGATTAAWSALSGSDITGAALTKTDDTNVTLTLGGTPTTALLRAASLTLGWTGQLAVGRGGTGASSLTGVVIGNGASAMTAVVGSASQLLRRNAGDTAYEFFTPNYLTANQTITLSGDVTGSGSTAISTTIANSVVTYAKIQNVAANSFLANLTGAPAVLTEIATSRIPLFGSSITGTPNSSTFLRGDGVWAAPPGGSGISRSVLVVSASGSLAAAASTDYIYSASGNITLTLPTAVGNTNRYTIKNAGSGMIIINTTASQTIDGEPTIEIRSQNNSVDLISDGTNWNII